MFRPLVSDGLAEALCVFCGAEFNYQAEKHLWRGKHASDCLWIEAKLAVEGTGKCPHCQGSGYVATHFDPGSSGVELGLGYMTDWEECKCCLGDG